MAHPIRVLIVDDNPTFIQAIKYFLATEPQVEVVGYTLSGRETLEQVKTLHPDLILLDYVMPHSNGMEVTRQLKALSDSPRVVIVTMYNNPEYRIQAEAAQADGFITKAKLGDELLPLIAALFPNSTTDENLPPGGSNENDG